MISFSSKKKNVKYLLCVIDAFTRLTWFKHLKYKILNIKNCSLDLKKLSDVVVNEVVKNTKFNKSK